MCHRQLGELGKHQRELNQLGAVVCAVSYEDGSTLMRMKMNHALGAGFVFLSDPVGELADEFNGLGCKSIHRPATYVLNSKLEPVYSFTHDDHHVRAPIQEVLSALHEVVKK